MLYYDESVSSKYAKYRQTRTQFAELRPLLDRYSVAEKVVLDVGCGTGQLVMLCKELGAKSATGVDLSTSMIQMAKSLESKDGSVNFVVGDAVALPFEDQSIDLIVSSYAIQHVPDSDAAFRNIARVLKPDGLFIGTLVWVFVEEGHEAVLGTEFPVVIGEGSDTVTVYDLIVSPATINAAIAKAGLEVVESTTFVPFSKVDPAYQHVDHVTRQAVTMVLRLRANFETN